MIIKNFKEIYFAFLPITLTTSSLTGICLGIGYGREKKEPFESFSTMIGFTSIGMITGITYPISFPLLTVYTLLKKP